MDNSKLMPQATQPVSRITTGQLSAQLAELSEETLFHLGENSSSPVLPSACIFPMCSYDGDDAE